MTWLVDFVSGRGLRLVLWVALVAIVAILGWRVTAWSEAYERLPLVEAELEAEIACAEDSKCWQRNLELQIEQDGKIQEVVEGYEQELAELAARRSRPVERRVIRVCPDAGTGDVRGSAAAAGPHGAAAATGVLSAADEFDTGPLRDLADVADEVSARLRGCQGWAEAVSAEPKP